MKSEYCECCSIPEARLGDVSSLTSYGKKRVTQMIVLGIPVKDDTVAKN